MDQMAWKYSVKTGSRRWSVQVFYNVLDLAAINSWVLYKECTEKNLPRREYILQLAQELRKKHLEQRETAKRVPTAEAGNPAESRKRRQCQVGKCNKNKTSDSCALCRKAAWRSALSVLIVNSLRLKVKEYHFVKKKEKKKNKLDFLL